MADNILDLDAIAPPSKSVKLNGKTYEVKPVTLEKIIKLQQISQGDKNEFEKIESLKGLLSEVIPGIESSELTEQQLIALVEFVYKTSIPQAESEQKKTTSQ